MPLMQAEDIRALRLSLNLTQAELGRLLNVSPWTVSRWESGAALPDLWQHDVLLRLQIGRDQRADGGEAVGHYLKAGFVGLALGVLLGAAVSAISAGDKPHPKPRRPRAGPRRRKVKQASR
ncbi:MAG: helix-turn-helix domain-containing protein [Sandaracinaceae bacterium]|nr:helix-turn-helix domain-containing protein [Sandaracinaceae bacterium]